MNIAQTKIGAVSVDNDVLRLGATSEVSSGNRSASTSSERAVPERSFQDAYTHVERAREQQLARRDAAIEQQHAQQQAQQQNRQERNVQAADDAKHPQQQPLRRDTVESRPNSETVDNPEAPHSHHDQPRNTTAEKKPNSTSPQAESNLESSASPKQTEPTQVTVDANDDASIDDEIVIAEEGSLELSSSSEGSDDLISVEANPILGEGEVKKEAVTGPIENSLSANGKKDADLSPDKITDSPEAVLAASDTKQPVNMDTLALSLSEPSAGANTPLASVAGWQLRASVSADGEIKWQTLASPLSPAALNLAQSEGGGNSMMSTSAQTAQSVLKGDELLSGDKVLLMDGAKVSPAVTEKVRLDSALTQMASAELKGMSAATSSTSSSPLINSSAVPANSYTMAEAKASFMHTGVQVPVGKPEWGQAVSDKVMWMASQNIKSAEIQLDPPELGSLQVKIQIHGDQATVSFSTPHASVRELLDQNANRLREMFESENLDLVDVGVSDQSMAQDSDTGDDNQQGSGANNLSGGIEGEEEVIESGVVEVLNPYQVDHYV